MALETVDIALDQTWRLISNAASGPFRATVRSGAALFSIGDTAPAADSLPGLPSSSLNFDTLAAKVWARGAGVGAVVSVLRTLDASNPAIVTLPALTLSASSFASTLVAGADIATIGGRVSGDKIESISPNDGRIVLSSDGTKLVRGLTATTDAPIKLEIVRSHPLAPNSPQRQAFTLMVAVPTLAISGTPGAPRASYHFHFLPTVTGGSGDKSFTLTGKLPDGLSFSSQSGTIYGRPLTGGQSFNGSIGVSDATGSASLPVSFTVAARGDGQARLVNTVMGGLICNNVLPTSGSKTRFKGRRAYQFGLFTPPSFQPTFCPFWTNGNFSQREVAAAQDITISKAAVVYNGVSVPVTYNGARTFTIPAGVAEFMCDPILPTAFGVAQFAPRSFVEYRHLFDLVAGQSAPYCDYSTDFNQSWRGTAADLGDDVDATGPMTVSNTPDSLQIFFPSMMLGVLPTGATSLGLIGDSLFRQQNDTGGLGRAGGGYPKRAAYAEGIPFMAMAVGGRTAEQTANSPKLMSLLEAGRFTDIHVGLGTNELAGSRDLSLIMADNRAIWASARKGGVRKIIQSTIQPRTTDNAYKCTDLANQSPVAGFEAGGRRDQFNAALAAERGINGGPDIIFPFSSYCSDPTTPSLWRVPAFSGTLTADIASGATSVPLSSAPAVLDNLVFEPGNSSNVDIGGQGGPRVASVSGSAAPYTASFVPSTTNPWNGAADGALGTPGKAHVSGTAVKATIGTDGTHPAMSAHVGAANDLQFIYRSLNDNRPNRYMIATTRFFMPGDYSTGSAAFINANGGNALDGGTSTVSSRYFYRRFKLRTSSWGVPQTAARFLFDNSALSIYGVRPSKFSLTLQRIEVRDSADNLVETLKVNGNPAATLAALTYDFAWTDPMLAALASDTDYYLDCYWTAPDASAWPAIHSRFLNGECSAASLNTDLSLTTPSKTQVFQALTGMYGPSMYIAKGCPAGRPVGIIVGTSIADLTTDGTAFVSDRNVSGFIQKGLDAPSGARIDAASLARYSSNMATVYQDNLTAGVSGISGDSRSIISHLKAVFAPLGQSKPPFNFIVSEHGRNDINRGTASLQATASAMYAALKAAWPGIPLAQVTTPPSTNFGGAPANATAWTTEADQTADNNNGTTGAWADWTAYILAGAGGQINVSIDTAATIRNGTKWKEDSWSATLVDAVAAGLDLRTNTIRLSSAPSVGDTLVFEPGTAQSGTTGLDYLRNYSVLSVTPHASSGFVVTLRPSARQPSYQDYTKSGVGSFAMQYDHAAGTTVKRSLTNDGVHPNQRSQGLMAAPVAAAKPAIATAAAAYEAA